MADGLDFDETANAARAAMLAGDHDLALKHWLEIVPSDGPAAPDDPKSWTRLGMALRAAGRTEDAIVVLEEALNRGETDFSTAQALIIGLLATHEPERAEALAEAWRATYPTDAWPHVCLAIAQYMLYDDDRARVTALAARELARAAPLSTAEMYENLVRILVAVAETPAALELLDERLTASGGSLELRALRDDLVLPAGKLVERRRPQTFEDWGRLAAELYALRRFDVALDVLERASGLTMTPEQHHQHHLSRAGVLGALGREAERVAALLEAMHGDPGDPGWWSALSLQLHELGDSRGTIEALKMAFELGLDSVPAEHLLVVLLIAADEFDDAQQQILRSLERHPGDGGLHVLLAQIQIAQRDPESALVAAEVARRSELDSTTMFSRLASVYFQLEDAALAIAVLDRGVAVADAHSAEASTIDASALLEHKARILFDMGRFPEAAATMRRLCRIAPRNPGHHHYLAEALVNADRFQEAVPAARKAIRLGDTAGTRRVLGAALAGLGTTLMARRVQGVMSDAPERARDALEKALEQLQIAITMDPQDGDAHRIAGHVFLALGRPSEARPLLEKAVAINPGDDRSRLALFQCRIAGYGENALGS